MLGKFHEYFVPRRNVRHERACVHLPVQREKAETLMRALRDENIRDRIVVGILDHPHHPQGNGHAEEENSQASGSCDESDERSTLFSTTRLQPAELLMGRNIRTTLHTL